MVCGLDEGKKVEAKRKGECRAGRAKGELRRGSACERMCRRAEKKRPSEWQQSNGRRGDKGVVIKII